MPPSIPAAMPASAPLTEEARTRTSTSLSAGVGAGRSSRRPGGVSKLSRVNALIGVSFPCGPRRPRTMSLLGAYVVARGLHTLPSARWSARVLVRWPLSNRRQTIVDQVQQYIISNDWVCYAVNTVTREVTQPTTSDGVLEECRSSPGLLLALLGQEAMRRLRDAHTAHNLKPRQFQLIGLLHDHGAMGQRELGEAMGVDPSILVTLLNPLEADGFVSRERDSGDRRRHVVTLTAAGRRHFDSATRAQREAEDALFAGLDDDQRQQQRDQRVALRDNLASRHEDACPLPETTEEC